MKRNPAVAFIFMISLITLLFVGCAHTVKIYDQLPDNVPKGYVEFYSEGVTDVRALDDWSVWKYQNGTIKNVTIRSFNPPSEWADSGWVKGPRRRIAERPGLHLFQVRLGILAVKEVKVEVIEGMITPVSVVIDNIKAYRSGYDTTYTFNMLLSVKAPIPYEEKERLRQEKERLQTQSAPMDSTDGPKESDIASGLTMVSNKQYTKAISSLESGLTWLKSDPSYRATSDSLVSKEAEYISKLIEQIRGANQKGVFDRSNSMAIVIETAIEAQAKIIKAIDDRRRSQTGSASKPSGTETTPAPLDERMSPTAKQTDPVVAPSPSLHVRKGPVTVVVSTEQMAVINSIPQEVGRILKEADTAKYKVVCFTSARTPLTSLEGIRDDEFVTSASVSTTAQKLMAAFGRRDTPAGITFVGYQNELADFVKNPKLRLFITEEELVGKFPLPSGSVRIEFKTK